jgi:sterol desaturase/sphingolipid hydroxylase (fatty acid hydroxylase superfamily)
MRLSKAGYFADFVVYPPIVLALLVYAATHSGTLSLIQWSIACLAGMATWTLLEYTIHRGILHRVRYFAEMHGMHHDSPSDLVGSPTWLTLAIICFGVLLPLWWQTNFDFAISITTGLMLGYLWYVTVHFAIHHWNPAPTTYLHRAQRRHLVHHYSRQPCNFGVTTGFWDLFFGTIRRTR